MVTPIWWPNKVVSSVSTRFTLNNKRSPASLTSTQIQNARIPASRNRKSIKSKTTVSVFTIGYVGKGYYGSTDEKSMIKEIHENGPVVLALNAAPDLYYYSSGVFLTNPTNSLCTNLYLISSLVK